MKKSEEKLWKWPHSSGDYAVEKWKTKIRFPHFPTAISLFEERTADGRASPPALRGGASRLPRQRLYINDECSS